MGATGATTPGGSRREGADEAVMEALRERLAFFAEKWRWFLRDPTMMGEMFVRAVMELHPEPEARQPEAARPPEPGEAPSGAPTGVELREASAQLVSGTTGITIKLGSDGKPVYPCRCGVDHGGDYAIEDWNHHNCFHSTPLVDIGWPELPVRMYLICMDCGEVFNVAEKDNAPAPDETRRGGTP